MIEHVKNNNDKSFSEQKDTKGNREMSIIPPVVVQS